MRTTLHIIAFSIKNFICKDVRNTNVLHSISKIGVSMVLFFLVILIPEFVFGQAASSNYASQTGTLGTNYSWIDCSSGSNIVTGDDAQASISWPFSFAFYDNTYTTANSLSVCSNGFIRLDGLASTNYTTASSYSLTSTATNLGQIVAMAVYDGKVGDNGGWVRSLVTGTSPNRIFTIEYNNLEIDYNDGRYTDVQVSFYETSYLVVIKLEADNINKNGVDIGIHSGVNNYFDKWQEVRSGTNNTWIEYTPTDPPDPPEPPAASWNYDFNTGTIGTTYSWIDCSAGSFVVSGDDEQAQISWPFDFNYYDNSYTTSKSLSVCTNGFIRLDGIASTDYAAASAYNLTSTAKNLGQIIAVAVYDGNVAGTGWVRSIVTGTAPERVFTIEFNNLEIDYNDGRYVDAQVSFYESINKVVLKLGADNINKSGVDMGLYSGVDTYFNKWQEVESGTNNTWIEYLPPYIEVNATIGTSTAYYFTLKSAFDKINDGTHQGEITIKIKDSTIETASAVLYASGTGASNFSSVNIYPTETGLSVSGNLTTPLIDLNGADNLTIDGRVNATGTTKDLTIINTNTGSAAATSAIRFINDASNNTVKYCTIQSSESRASSGILFFSTTTASSGNDNNVIEDNNITTADDANRPVNAIYSSGTSGKDNSGNIIRNNNIYDFIKHATASRGILLVANTNAWTIDGNSFYETASFSPTGTVTYEAIRINNVSGNGFTVSNNYVGGREPQCGGTAWTKTNATNNVFNAIYLNLGTTSASSVQNNTIQNFNWSNSGSATWAGINLIEGSVNIGTISGNTIGSTTGTNSIVLSGGSNGQSNYGIKITSTGDVNCFNNNIGSITASTTSTLSTHIYGIDLSGSGVVNIESNTIGSTTTANSIFASSASAGNVQEVCGIFTRSTGATDIHDNIISNLKNNTSNTVAGTQGFINGITLTAGTNSVEGNTIRDISIANANTNANNPSIAGIRLNTTNDSQSIQQNLIYNISNTYSSFTGSVVGIYARNSVGAGAGDINANFIHSLSVDAATSGARIYGIFENTDGIVYSNNIINLGGSTSSEMHGLYDGGDTGKTGEFFFNSIYISGTNSGSEKSYALRYNTNNNTRDLRNNILFNARTGGSGGHYAIYYDATGGTFTADHNDYYVSGTGGIIGYFGGDQNTLALLQTATGQDVNSLNINPAFAAAGGTNSSNYATSASLPGVAITGITADYDGITRNSPPKMGALEVSPTFTWQGNTSTDFATTSNWEDGVVPLNGANISFASTPTNDCYLDQNRTLNNITNTSSKKLVINSHQLTITGNIVSATSNQIDASATSSMIIFAGDAAQNIPGGGFVTNTIDGLTLNNIHGLTQNGDLIVPTALALTTGDFTIGANTLTINGAISTTSGSLTGGSTSNIIIGGSGASAILPGVSLNNLTLNRANGISLGGSLSVEGALTLTSGTLTLGSATLTISGSAPTRTSGDIDASNISATVEFSNSSAITLPASLFNGDINNLTINGSGITAGSDLTINGILNLQSTNPSASKGSLDMSSHTLNMESASTTTGDGDVTGIVRREHTFAQNVAYSFGSQYSTFTFNDGNSKPNWISLEISIGSVAPWTPWSPSPDGKVKRIYKVASSENSSTSAAAINLRYLLSELDATYNDESKLIFWHKFVAYGGGLPHEHGKSNQDFTNHFIGITGLILGAATSSDPDDSQVTMAYSITSKNTWKGEVAGHETEWEQAQNWTAGHVPLSTEDVLIPGGLTYYPSLTASANAVAKTIEINTGASFSANSYDITISGAGGAWINNGMFNAGSGKVVFNHGVLSEVVTIAGVTNFYDIEAGANTTMQPVSGCILRIAGIGSADVTSVVDFSTINNTVEWNGANQTIVNPNGIGGNSSYYTLILSGSGTKTMPATAMNIADGLRLDGTVTVTAQAPLTIGAEFEILDNASFATGNYDHTIGGDFDNRGTFTASSGTNITLNGTTVQEIYGDTPTTFEELTINNAAGINIITDITVNNTLTLSSGNLNILLTTLTINGAITKTSGFLNTATTSSLTFGGTTALSLASNIFFSPPSITNLSINRTGGVDFSTNIALSGILNLQSTNPSSTQGTLDLNTYTLNMGENATTIGTGDVTGIVKREHVFNLNTEYTFGSQYTTFSFTDGNLKPTWISLQIEIGAVPSWSPWSPSPNGKVKRLYKVASSDNSSTSQATINMRYLVSELDATYNDELKLVFWHMFTDFMSGVPHEHGKANQDITNHFIGVTGLPLGSVTTDDLDDSEVGMAYSIFSKNTWKGTVVGFETQWEQTQNWTAGHVPLSTEDVLIPGGLTYYPSLTSSSNAVAKTIEIQSGASITANSYNMTISGFSGAWNNLGTFNAGTGKVLFNHGVLAEIVTIAGTTNFYDIQVGANTTLQPISGNVLRIAGVGSADITSQIDFSVLNNTVEWNGANQTIVNPIGIGGNSGYYNLIISGSGTKTMPGTEMTVNNDFTISGTASATAADSIIVLGDATIENGATFATGSHNHFLGGNFENNGTFTPTSGGTVTFNGTSAQTISGSSSTSFDELCLESPNGVTLERDITVNNMLSLCDGPFYVGANTLGINGTISNISGNIEVTSSSSLSFGGTSAITLNNNLFNGHPTINNLTINRSGGVTMGNESITVNGTMILTSGTFTIAANTLTLAGNSPTRTSGNLDASNTGATIAFENSTAITLPASLFSGDINNMTVNGAGGVTASDDITINGILNLESANPTSAKGSLDMSTYTLDMGEDATTIGQGDVSGIIRRTTINPNITYTFGNQYSNIYFPDFGTLPTEMSLKVTLGSSASWRTGTINRIYELIQTGGNGTHALIHNHYLDSELNGNDESKLGEWMYIIPTATTIDYGRSGQNTNENWVAISNVNVGVFAPVFGIVEIGMDEYENTNLTWIGATSTSWVTASNWTPMGAPSDETVLTIPDASTTPNDPNIPEIAICGKMIIESGGILNSISGGQLTITGASGAWVNDGTFNPETGTIIFDNGDETQTVTISGTTNFYNLTVAEKTWIQPAANSVINIDAQFSADISSILDFGTNANTVNYNGNKAQDVIDPGASYAYYNLALGGSEVKTLPSTTFQIVADFAISGDASTTITNDLTVGANLNISNTAELAVEAGKTLTIVGTTSNSAGNAGLVLQSSSSGTASIMHSSDNVPATVQRYISGDAEDWHFLSSPVSNQSFSGEWLPTGTYGNGTGYDLYVWHEPTPCWVYHLNTTVAPTWPTVHPSANFVAGRGYLYSVQSSNPTKEFAGNLNNGNISYGITNDGSADLTLQGFNLAGNPYPSSIDWMASSGWTRNNLLTSGGGYDIWIWNPDAGNYGVYNSADGSGVGTNAVTRYIAPMQGFFVRAQSNGNLGMANDIRVHDNTTQWKSGHLTSNRIAAVVYSEGNQTFDEVRMFFGYPQNKDGAAKLFSPLASAPALYLPVEESNLSIRYLSDTVSNKQVPLFFKAGIDGLYSIEFDFKDENFDTIILEDKQTGEFVDLSLNNNYRFNASVNENESRFVLHFEAIRTTKDLELPAHIYSSDSKVILDLTAVSEPTDVVIFDILGRKILQKNVAGNTIHQFQINNASQVFVVFARTRNACVSQKVFVY